MKSKAMVLGARLRCRRQLASNQTDRGRPSMRGKLPENAKWIFAVSQIFAVYSTWVFKITLCEYSSIHC
jgi:hypothetical protein